MRLPTLIPHDVDHEQRGHPFRVEADIGPDQLDEREGQVGLVAEAVTTAGQHGVEERVEEGVRTPVPALQDVQHGQQPVAEMVTAMAANLVADQARQVEAVGVGRPGAGDRPSDLWAEAGRAGGTCGDGAARDIPRLVSHPATAICPVPGARRRVRLPHMLRCG